jgi:CRISPR-associated endonuclease Csn1
MKYRLGIDLGTSSIGIAAYSLDGENKIQKLEYLDSYIFGEPVNPKNMTTLNTQRRAARLARRQVERKANRLKKLGFIAKSVGVSKDDVKKISGDKIHELRAKAISEKLELPEFVKVLFHIVKNRGYKGDLKRAEGDVSKKIKETEAMFSKDGVRTLGQVLYEKKLSTKNNGPWRKLNEGGTFILREDIKKEFDLIWQEQAKHHKGLLGNYNVGYDNMFPDRKGEKEISLKDAFKSAMFYQRPIKWDVENVGDCEYAAGQKRAATAQIAYQNYRLANNISKLRIKDESKQGSILSAEQIIKIYNFIDTEWESYAKGTDKVPYAKIYELLNFDEKQRFTIDRNSTTKEDAGIKGNTTLKCFYDIGVFNDFQSLPDKAQELVIEFLSNITKYSDIQDNDEGYVRNFFEKLTQNISDVKKEYENSAFNFIKRLKSKEIFINKEFKLEQGRASYSVLALNKITAELLKGKEETQIIKELYPPKEKEERDNLRAYEEIEKQESINDAVMAKALREFKRTMDFVVKKFGKPDEIIIELSREIKNSLRKRQYIEGENKKQRAERLEAVKELQENNIPANARNIEKYLLWLEQDKKCPYSGNNIIFAQAFSESETQIDHIIPQAIGGPNIFANKILAFTKENKEKSDKVPYSWKFAKDIDEYSALSKSNKTKRKAGERIEIFGSHSPLINLIQHLWTLYNKEKNGYYNQKKHKYEPTQKGKIILQKINNLLIKPEDIKDEFANRQNQETAWIGKIVMDWCEDICQQEKITPSFGTLTAYLRQQLHFDRVLPHVRIAENKPLFDDNDPPKELNKKVWQELFAEPQLNYKDAKALKEDFEKHLENLPQENKPSTDSDKQKEFRHFCADKRNEYKFNKRCDHRHHAVDAAIIGLCDRSMVQRASTHNARHGTLHKYKYIKFENGKEVEVVVKGFLGTDGEENKNEKSFAPLYNELRKQTQKYLTGYAVWHKPDHFPSGAFFDQTAYGVCKDKEDSEIERLTIRQSLEKILNKEKNADKVIEKLKLVVVGDTIKEELVRQLKERMGKGLSLEEAFLGKKDDVNDGLFYRGNKIKSVKVLYKEKYLMSFSPEIDGKIQLSTSAKDGKFRSKHYQNAGYACMDFDTQSNERAGTIPIWKYQRECENKPVSENTTRIFAGDILYDKKENIFYKVKSFHYASLDLISTNDEKGIAKQKSAKNLKDLILCKTRADIAKIKFENKTGK